LVSKPLLDVGDAGVTKNVRKRRYVINNIYYIKIHKLKIRENMIVAEKPNELRKTKEKKVCNPYSSSIRYYSM
jgi:hypothetical protein